MILGVILARGGSKRLPRKNILPFCGKPLVAWTIEAGLGAPLDEVLVSTEDAEIAAWVAPYVGLPGPRISLLIRDPELASDTTTSYEALLDAIDARMLADDDIVVLLQPTSPLRTAEDIDATVEYTKYIGAPAVSMAEDADVPNGAVYVATAGWLRAGGNWDNAQVAIHRMPADRSIDIDTLEDFQRAEAIMKAAA